MSMDYIFDIKNFLEINTLSLNSISEILDLIKYLQ